MIAKRPNRELPDEELMALSSAGNNGAFTELYERYSGKLNAYFYRMLWSDPEKARDMTQELFTKIIQRPERYKKGKKFSTWIYSIASNMCKNEYRHHEVVQRHSPGVQDLFSSTSRIKVEEIDHSDFKVSLEEELGKLGHDHRATFIMRYKQGLSIKEIAAVMDCSEGTVKSRVFYALKKLAKGLHQFDPKRQ